MNELRELDQQLRPHWNAFDTKRPPGSIILAPGYKVSMNWVFWSVFMQIALFIELFVLMKFHSFAWSQSVCVWLWP